MRTVLERENGLRALRTLALLLVGTASSVTDINVDGVALVLVTAACAFLSRFRVLNYGKRVSMPHRTHAFTVGGLEHVLDS